MQAKPPLYCVTSVGWQVTLCYPLWHVSTLYCERVSIVILTVISCRDIILLDC